MHRLIRRLSLTRPSPRLHASIIATLTPLEAAVFVVVRLVIRGAELAPRLLTTVIPRPALPRPNEALHPDGSLPRPEVLILHPLLKCGGRGSAPCMLYRR